LLTSLKEHQVDTQLVRATAGSSSGVAIISVDEEGENSITIIAGANHHLTTDDVTRCEDAIAQADVLLVQLETPIETVSRAIQLARAHDVTTILDPAPAPTEPLPAMLRQVDVLSPNQTEAELLTGVPVQSPQDAERAASVLHAGGARHVVMKLGEMGALVYEGPGLTEMIPARPVTVVDTTAAGDAFTAGLAIGYASGWSAGEATRLGCAAGTLATTRLGAQQSMPTRREVDQFL
jgi:ribokinase